MLLPRKVHILSIYRMNDKICEALNFHSESKFMSQVPCWPGYSWGLYVILPGVLPSLASLIPKIAAGHPGDLGPLQVGSFSFLLFSESAWLRERYSILRLWERFFLVLDVFSGNSFSELGIPRFGKNIDFPSLQLRIKWWVDGVVPWNDCTFRFTSAGEHFFSCYRNGHTNHWWLRWSGLSGFSSIGQWMVCLALFWIRISTRLWWLSVRYRQHCLHSRVALAILLPLPAGLLLSLILFSTDMCLVMSEDDPWTKVSEPSIRILSTW